MSDPNNSRLTALLEQLQGEFPGFRIVAKDQSPLHRTIHNALILVTLGRMRNYLQSYQTTIRRTVYVTSDWHDRDASERYIILRHERIHLRQFKRFTLVGMALLYVFLPLPMGLAYFRARFEMAAYEETIRAAAAIHGIPHVRDPEFRNYIISQFTGPSYGWMWPFRQQLNTWYDGIVSVLSAE